MPNSAAVHQKEGHGMAEETLPSVHCLLTAFAKQWSIIRLTRYYEYDRKGNIHAVYTLWCEPPSQGINSVTYFSLKAHLIRYFLW